MKGDTTVNQPCEMKSSISVFIALFAASSLLLEVSSKWHSRRSFAFTKVNLTLEREVAGVWIKVPCVDDFGSSYYPDACERLAQLFMTIPELCPEPKSSSSIPCGCPFRAAVFQELYSPQSRCPGGIPTTADFPREQD